MRISSIGVFVGAGVGVVDGAGTGEGEGLGLGAEDGAVVDATAGDGVFAEVFAVEALEQPVKTMPLIIRRHDTVKRKRFIYELLFVSFLQPVYHRRERGPRERENSSQK
ncbi:hypothetical protein HMPREF3293_01003 [Christensenella minuta]|jgi:hypothetical protein|uniref:Uncharacterized protein n=1 Tax=Christensenella minuta TaxID=626937 RepID=A0A136Q6S1_9FIRM|nr:hypothetical protein HMPREF3293_01003 [Christensenella minuta]